MPPEVAGHRQFPPIQRGLDGAAQFGGFQGIVGKQYP
jgi:hypothetical protein